MPSNAWACSLEPLGIEAFWSPTDVSVPGVISCTPATVNTWIELGLDVATEVLKSFFSAERFLTP